MHDRHRFCAYDINTVQYYQFLIPYYFHQKKSSLSQNHGKNNSKNIAVDFLWYSSGPDKAERNKKSGKHDFTIRHGLQSHQQHELD